jgi:hypothetical protein
MPTRTTSVLAAAGVRQAREGRTDDIGLVGSRALVKQKNDGTPYCEHGSARRNPLACAARPGISSLPATVESVAALSGVRAVTARDRAEACSTTRHFVKLRPRAPCHRLCDQREARRQVVARSAVEPHPFAILAGDDPETVKLDFVQLNVTGGRGRGFDGQARRQEAERQASLHSDQLSVRLGFRMAGASVWPPFCLVSHFRPLLSESEQE